MTGPTERHLDQARKLFFDYDGSGFYMSRDGVDVEYQRYSVSKELEREWLDELTAIKLKKLQDPGNWSVVHFLWHHGDSRQLSLLIQTKPLGAFWERCAFLEELLVYIGMCSRGASLDEIRDAADYALVEARGLEASVSDEKSRKRLDRLISSATDLRSSHS